MCASEYFVGLSGLFSNCNHHLAHIYIIIVSFSCKHKLILCFASFNFKVGLVLDFNMHVILSFDIYYGLAFL